MPDDQFIFSSSWLPSLGFELWTLAGYTALHTDTRKQVQVLFTNSIKPTDNSPS